MSGIVGYGAYIPKYRLSRDLIAGAWGSYAPGGEKAVAAFDEDAITMAVEAAFDCLQDAEPQKLDGLYFASTSAPYREKQCSTLISAVLDMRRDVVTADFSNSLRSGTAAFKAALDAVEARKADRLLVCVADCRLPTPKSDLELSLGDAAAAFVVGDTKVIAEVIAEYAVADEFTDYWRMEQDRYIKTWEDRFSNVYGHTASVEAAVKGLLQKTGLSPHDFTKLALQAPSVRQQLDVARRLGFDPKSQVADALLDSVGDSGAALAPLALVSALEASAPGDRILWVAHGQGAHAFAFKVTPVVETVRNRGTINKLLASKTMLPSYQKYIQFREIMDVEKPRVFPSPSSVPLFWRERKSIYSFRGSKCRECSLIVHPVQRICYRCGAQDSYEELRLARRGKIFTYAEDYLADAPVLPQISASIDLEDGARVYLRLTECEAQSPTDPPQKIGMPVEITFRKVNDASGFRNYYWKAKPIRKGGIQ